jgi:hypothetical protein
MQAANGFPRTVAAAILVLTIVPVTAAKYGGGSGTPDDPYQIWTPEQMDAIGADPNNWDKCFKLMADIDLSTYSGNSFHMIGSRWGTLGDRPFTGVFDGDGHTITGLSYSSQETSPAGLFAYVGGLKAEVRNLSLTHAKIEMPKAGRVGALVGCLEAASVTNCSATDVVVVAGSFSVGGLVGECAGNVSKCSCTGTVQGDFKVGGLVGYTERRWLEVWDGWYRRVEVGAITGCRFEGTVTGTYYTGGLIGNNEADIASCDTAGSVTAQRSAGGLVGYNDDSGEITACWSTADVKGAGQPATQFAGDSTGGFAGTNAGVIKSCWASGNVEADTCVGGFVGTAFGTISHCYATGAAMGRNSVGGFAGVVWTSISFSYSTARVEGSESVGGFAPGGLVYLCYWDRQTSGMKQGSAGKGRTTAQMMNAATFAGWGYESQWVIADGTDYPRLIWENAGGELLVDLPRTYGGGSGEPNDPYLIDTVDQFVAIGYYREDFGKHFRLTTDLDFNEVDVNEFIPLTINGSFDGAEHRIHNFRYMADASNAVGLFANVGPGASVQDLHLVDARVAGVQDVGALVGRNSGQVRICSVTGTIEGTRNIGGLVGYNEGRVETCTVGVQVSGQTSAGALAGRNLGRIEACAANGEVLGQSSVGGLVGWNDREIVSSCSTADVTGDAEVGGLVGTAGEARHWMACPAPPPSFVPGLSDSRITACYSTGQATGQQLLGGLVGKNAGVVKGCYAASPIQIVPVSDDPVTPPPRRRAISITDGPEAATAANAGGLVGENDYGLVYLSYWDVECSGLLQSAGGRGKTTAQMTDPETFRGWSQLGVWLIEPGRSYPYFESADAAGEPLVDDPHRYGGGTGTVADPYQIYTPQQWLSLGYCPGDWDKHFVLMRDLDLSGVDPDAVWIIGIPTAPFAGTFEGNGHTIANFMLWHDAELYIGMFGYIGSIQSVSKTEPARIFNLHLKNVDILGNYHVGGLAAYSDKYGVISACSVTGRITATGKNAGGVVGYSLGTLEGCSSNCQVTADQVAGELAGLSGGPVTSCSGAGTIKTVGQRDSYAGGLIGESYGKVQFCHFTGEIIGAYTAGGLVALNENEIFRCSAQATISGTYLLGGLVGYNEYGAIIRESFADSAVTGGNSAGGLVGHNVGKIANCFATGQVQGDDRVGGLMGDGYREIKFCYSTCRVSGRTLVGGFAGELARWGPFTVASCFWDVDASAKSDGVAGMDPDPNGVTGLPTASMKTSVPFLAAGWDFVDETANGTEDIWQMHEGQGYPRLSWEATKK